MTVTDISRKADSPKIIRLAAYCRVSSKSADQLHSFAAQIRYYKEYERKNPQYKLVDVYADEGLSGTDMKKRDEQNRLIRAMPLSLANAQRIKPLFILSEKRDKSKKHD